MVSRTVRTTRMRQIVRLGRHVRLHSSAASHQGVVLPRHGDVIIMTIVKINQTRMVVRVRSVCLFFLYAYYVTMLQMPGKVCLSAVSAVHFTLYLTSLSSMIASIAKAFGNFKYVLLCSSNIDRNDAVLPEMISARVIKSKKVQKIIILSKITKSSNFFVNKNYV